MTQTLVKVRTILALGIYNVFQVGIYRTLLRLRLHPVQRLKDKAPPAPFYQKCLLQPLNVPASKDWESDALLFGWKKVALKKEIPNWHENAISGVGVIGSDRKWWEISDFESEVGDIKLVWELSRMNWVLAFAQRARNGDTKSLSRLNSWVQDWSECNPPYVGPNWKCGQEASIRVMHLAVAAIILGRFASPADGLVNLIRIHLRRIAPTIGYAVAQDNNHGTSEAAALFIGGSWLRKIGIPEGRKWEKRGRKVLENRVEKLISSTGGFSQYSLNYHRVLLDTLSIVEVWRDHLELAKFSPKFYQRAQAATEWLRNMIDPTNGCGPNTGANDGAQLIPLAESDYRDYRPSVQLGAVLFSNQLAYSSEGSWNQALEWLDVERPAKPSPPPSTYSSLEDGFVILRKESTFALLRCPQFRFRPSHADALHLDLWVRGVNILRDDGSYSYNTDETWMNYFGGTSAHNTVQFDNRNQMPRVSRFLFGNWLKVSEFKPIGVSPNATSFSCKYQDNSGVSHQRSIQLEKSRIKIVDQIAGFRNSAILRWRLKPDDWQLEYESSMIRCWNEDIEILMTSVNDISGKIVDGWESIYYNKKTKIPVLEVEIFDAGALSTVVNWSID